MKKQELLNELSGCYDDTEAMFELAEEYFNKRFNKKVEHNINIILSHINLFTVVEIKLKIESIGIKKIDIHNEGARIVFTEAPEIDPARLIQLIQSNAKMYKFNGKDTLYITADLESHTERKNIVVKTLMLLTNKTD